MGVRIVVDLDLCQGHGVCEGEAPELFRVGEDMKVVVLAEHPDDDRRASAEMAVRYCPTHAIVLVED